MASDLHAEGDIVGNIHIRKKRIGLEHHANITLSGPLMGDVTAVNGDCASAWRFKPCNHAQHSGFAAA